MNRFDRLVTLEYKILQNLVNDEKFRKNERMVYFTLLAGIGPYSISIEGEPHNSNIVVEAIHKYYADTKNSSIIQNYEEAILTMIRAMSNLSNLESTVDVIFYQCHLEKCGNATFHINKGKIIDSLNRKIKENIENFKNLEGFTQWYEKKRGIALREYEITF